MDKAFVGFCGLKCVDLGNVPISGEVEIGWRLRRDASGQGYAREAAAVALAWSLADGGLHRVVAMTNHGNTRSWGLMERLALVRRRDLDFDHPALDRNDPLRPHIVYATAAS